MSIQGLAAQSLVTFRNSQGTEARGTLLKLTRSTIVFEVYNPYSVVQLSEVLHDLILQHNQQVTYQGKAVVTNLVNTGLIVIVSVTLVDTWHHFPKGFEKPTSARHDIENFIYDWKKTNNIRPGFRLAVSEIRTFLSEFSQWLRPRDNGSRETDSVLPRDLFLEISSPIVRTMKSMFDIFESEASKIPEEQRDTHQAYVRRDLHPLIMTAPFVHRAYSKPLGYAGDYEMVNMMIRDDQEGPTTYSQVIHALNLQLDVAKAHRNRIDILFQQLTETSEIAASQERTAEILNIGCGPAEEVRRFMTQMPLSNRCSFRLIDFNEETITHTRDNLYSSIRISQRNTNIDFVNESVHILLKKSMEKKADDQTEKYDLVYCAGLFDYLSDKVCSRLINLFYRWTKPGGVVLTTNVHPSNPNRMALEYILDWYLIYRDEKQMESLCPSLGQKHTFTDKTGVNVFLKIRKNEL